jgi:hypothetical protein
VPEMTADRSARSVWTASTWVVVRLPAESGIYTPIIAPRYGQGRHPVLPTLPWGLQRDPSPR